MEMALPFDVFKHHYLFMFRNSFNINRHVAFFDMMTDSRDYHLRRMSTSCEQTKT